MSHVSCCFLIVGKNFQIMSSIIFYCSNIITPAVWHCCCCPTTAIITTTATTMTTRTTTAIIIATVVVDVVLLLLVQAMCNNVHSVLCNG